MENGHTNGHVTDERIRAEIKGLIAKVTERTPDEIPDGASFGEELGVDSLMAIEIMVDLDRKFGIDIPEGEFQQIRSVDDAVSAVRRHLPVALVQ